MLVTRSAHSPGTMRPLAVALQSCDAVSLGQHRWPQWQSGSTEASTQEPFAYDEETFRYFLTLEERRSERSGRPFVLVLVDVNAAESTGENGSESAMASEVEGALDELFKALVHSLRETDFVGWYRNGQVAGAVLTQLGETSEGGDISRLVREKVIRALHGLSPWARLLKVQIHQLPSVEAKTGTKLWR